MRVKVFAIAASLALALPCMPAQAQSVSYEGCYLGGRGDRMAAVPSVTDPSLRDVGRAIGWRGRPVIGYNPYLVELLSPQTRLFFYVHECAHHVLGHTAGEADPNTMEQQADCWAVRDLVAKGLFRPRDVATVQADIARHGRADATHAPGGIRAINLLACLG